MELKQYYKDNMFHKQYELSFGDCDPKGRIKISAIMEMMSEIAGADFANRGYPYEFLLENNIVFLLSRISGKIHRTPKSDDILTLKTWEVGTKGVSFLRYFEFYDNKQNLLVSAKSSWIMVNPHTRRPCRPSSFEFADNTHPDKDADCKDPGKIVCADMPNFVSDREIMYSDLDANGHTHNTRYGDFAIDVMPDNMRQNDIKEFKINFVSEALLGQKIMMHTQICDNEITIIGKKDDNSCFEAQFII